MLSRLRTISALLLLLPSMAFGGGVIWDLLAAAGMPSSITVPLAWGEIDCTGTPNCDSTSFTQTLTIPAGNSGVIKFSVPTDHTPQYQKNSGSFTTVTDGATATFANGDKITLKIKNLGCSVPDVANVILTDNSTGAYIGGGTGFTASNLPGC